jgi:hypothetical protein
MEVVDILECKQMLRKPSSASSASKLSENFILQISAKASHIRMLCRSQSVDDKDFASILRPPSISQDEIEER